MTCSHLRSTVRVCTALAVATASVPIGSAQAQTSAAFEPAAAREHGFPLTIESIMRGPEHIGQAPVAVRWSDDGAWIYFRWLPGGAEWHEERVLYRVAATGGEPERVDEETELELAPTLSGGDVSSDGRWRIVSTNGDLYLIERATNAVRRLTHTADAESNPAFAGDDGSVFFQRDRNLYAFELATGAARQLTFSDGPDERGDPEPEGHKAFLEEQQRELFEHVRVREIREERDEAREERRDARSAEPIHLDADERVQGLRADPTGRYAAFSAVRSGEAVRTDIPLWVTGSGYTENTEMRAKVGDEQSSSRLAVVETATGEVTWLDLSGDGDGHGSEEGGDPPDRHDDVEEGEDHDEDDDRLAVAAFADWNESGTHGLVFAVDYDYKTWRLYAYEAASGELTLLDSHHDEAWVGGPCFGFGGATCMGWLPGDDARAYYVSEETGFAHVYAI
ncbi:MAG: DPP IV N-terminal domain-containing protein, partial [Gemmatimonadetes bacterium]|nr:DPP IV N-terminal domain-containing protein [Gemmatimonadota bacterium]